MIRISDKLRTWGAFAALVFAATAPLSAQAGAPRSPASGELFPAVKCAVTESLERSRDFLEHTYAFIRPNGIFPWPGVSDRFSIDGIWVNSARGTYAVLQQIEDEHSPLYGALSVKFFSACDHRLLAEGTRILSLKDWDSSTLSIPLKNHGLKGSRLRAYIQVNLDPEDSAAGIIEIQVREARVGTRDHFFMSRFE